MSQSLLLDIATWDLTLDNQNNIAVASEPYRIAQDAACAIKLFSGELWYDTNQGVPYFGQILGQFPSVALMKQKLESAALTAPGVVNATCLITAISGRKVTGQVQVTSTDGTTTPIGF